MKSPLSSLLLMFMFALPGAARLTAAEAARPSPEPVIEVWQGDRQRTGHLGDVQDDFNVHGHVEPWREIDTLEWSLNYPINTPLSYRIFRRLVNDGDFNIDIPAATLKADRTNQLTITMRLRDGRSLSRTVEIRRETGARPLPLTIRWKDVKNPADVGTIVDGRWEVTPAGLRTRQIGYDRLFLIGERTWRDYEARTTITLHRVDPVGENGGAGVGLIARFTGHVTGGPRYFASGQPKWGFQPFGAIGWLRWNRGENTTPPQAQFFPGDSYMKVDAGEFPLRLGETYAIRFACRTLPDDPTGAGVTRYQFKIWPQSAPEPSAWTWEQTQTSRDALRAGGLCLVAHFVDVTYGDVTVTALPPE
jgi:hypothetical protein